MRLTRSGAPSTDPDLIARARAGDAAAYSELFERHREAATRLATQLARTPSDADDLVADAFERVLRQLRQGKGPDVSFRAYLLTTLRHAHFRNHRAEKVTMPTDDASILDQTTQEPDPVLSAFENASAARAFASLPERWQMILWHLEVEGQRPAQVAELLGLKPNAVSALAYRAREALRQAYLLQHVADAPDESHAAVLEQLPALVRKKLGRRDEQRVRRHLDGCATCSAAYAEVSEMGSRLSAFLAPVVLGAAAGPYLRAVPVSTLTLLHHPWEVLQHWINHTTAPTALVHKSVVALTFSLATGLVAGGVLLARPEAYDVPPGLSAPTAEPETAAAPAPVIPSARPTSRPRTPSAVPSPSATAPVVPRDELTAGSSPPSSGRPTTPTTPTTSTTPTAPATPAPSEPALEPASTEPPVTPSTVPEASPLRADFQVVPDDLSVTVHARATGGRGRYAYAWRFGDGAVATGAFASHRYADRGSYTIVLTVSDGDDSQTVTRSVTIRRRNEPPHPAFLTRVDASTVEVDASYSSDPDGRIVDYAWDFGDGSTGTGMITSHTYRLPGEHRVRLTVTDDSGARGTRFMRISVGPRASECPTQVRPAQRHRCDRTW